MADAQWSDDTVYNNNDNWGHGYYDCIAKWRYCKQGWYCIRKWRK